MTVRTTHTHLFNGPFPGLPRWAGTRKVKPIWILLKQETVSGSGISWAICKCAPRSRQITLPAPHHSVFLQAGCPSCRPTNSVKALTVRTIRAKLSLGLPSRSSHLQTGGLVPMQHWRWRGKPWELWWATECKHWSRRLCHSTTCRL